MSDNIENNSLIFVDKPQLHFEFEIQLQTGTGDGKKKV